MSLGSMSSQSTVKLVFATTLQNAQLYGVRGKIGWLGIGIMCSISKYGLLFQ
jgi:hypothetical protein